MARAVQRRATNADVESRFADARALAASAEQGTRGRRRDVDPDARLRVPDPHQLLRPEDGARGHDPRGRHVRAAGRRAQDLRERRDGGTARCRRAGIRRAREPRAAHRTHQRHATLSSIAVPARVLRAWRAGPGRARVLRVARHRQRVPDRAVLVVRERHLHRGARQAAVRDHRGRWLARRDVRPAPRQARRHVHADADRGRDPARVRRLVQCHRARTTVAATKAPSSTRSDHRTPAASRSCCATATCC